MKSKPQPKPRVQTRLIDKKPAFLAAFVKCANLSRAAQLVEIDRGQHYEWLRDDADYAKAFADAKLQAGDTLKDIAVEWATVGILEPNVFQGRFVYEQRERKLVTLENGEEIDLETHKALEERLGQKVPIADARVVKEDFGPPLGVHRRSEGLMARLLKVFLPNEFGDKLSAELTGPGGGPMEIVARLNAARQRVVKKLPKP